MSTPPPSPPQPPAPPPPPATVDVLTLESCEELQGEIVGEDMGTVVLKQAQELRRVPRREIVSILRDQPLGEGAATRPVTTGRLLGSGHMLDLFATRPWVKSLELVPSTVVDSGPLRNVPYLSYRAAELEFNIYGDPQQPAGMEIGVYGGTRRFQQEIRDLVAGFLTRAEDRELARHLSLEQDKQTREGLTFEVTPPSAPDAYGGWWVSIYDGCAIEKARVTP